MKLEDFNEFLAKSDIGDKICFIKYKYSWEDKPRYTNELLIYSPESCRPYSEYCWEYDWYEGEEEVEILGCIDVCDVIVPLFAGGDNSALL